MAEYLALTDPKITPEVVTSKYRVVTLRFHAPPAPAPVEHSAVDLTLIDEHGGTFEHRYTGQEALDLIKGMNTANFSTGASMHKRILQKLSNDGVLPGTVSGTPDPPSA